jgi:hypothetical protein
MLGIPGPKTHEYCFTKTPSPPFSISMLKT